MNYKDFIKKANKILQEIEINNEKNFVPTNNTSNVDLTPTKGLSNTSIIRRKSKRRKRVTNGKNAKFFRRNL